MNNLMSTASAASVRKTWGFRATSRVHGDGKQSKGYNRRKESRSWRKDQ